MKKHYILFSMQAPDLNNAAQMAWWRECDTRLQNHTTKLNTATAETTILQLAQHVWLIEREHGADFLSTCFYATTQCSLSYMIRFLADDT